jgi:hypothetical protein
MRPTAGVPLPGVALQGGEDMVGPRLDAAQHKRVIAGDREHVVHVPALAAPAQFGVVTVEGAKGSRWYDWAWIRLGEQE